MSDQKKPPIRRKYVPAVGPRLKKLLAVVFALFAVLAVNSVYLASVTFFEWFTGEVYQNWFYLLMFLFHVFLGLIFVAPFIAFGIAHLSNAYNRRNRRAVWVGVSLFITSLLLLASGIVLLRLEGVIVVRDPTVRSVAYWIHVVTPLLAAWLFVLHRLAGRRIKWKIGLRWAGAAAGFALLMLVIQAQDPRRWNVEGNPSGEKYFFPSLARTVSGDFIPAGVLDNDEYCQQCHSDIHAGWLGSVHHFSSFNNPPYLFSVKETREVAMQRDGTVQASRWCAGCHDPVPFFSGKFDDPEFDMENDPTAKSGITCTVCHSITHINSVKGNADYTIEEPLHYPFAGSSLPTLQWINGQLIKAKPAFHRKTFLKPFHKTAEFCSTCHKVHLPPELNKYKWLRGQNHYDSFLLSGVSGHGVASFYYPEKAEENCNNCHMPLETSSDFGARDFDSSGQLKIHSHLFPSANTAIPVLVGLDNAMEVVAAHQAFQAGIVRVDLFGVRRGGTIDGPLEAPVRPEVPTLEPGESYLFETVIRTLKMGHILTQGTADSNQLWLDVTVSSDGKVLGRSGDMDSEGRVDSWSHFVNVYMLDRKGNRIDRRNAQDIFVPLYNNQIAPGSADVVHYLMRVPDNQRQPLTVKVELKYRKFDTTYMKYVYGEDYVNRLPVSIMAADQVTFPVADSQVATQTTDIPIWQRWNDYGIGLLEGDGQGELRQAEEAFFEVEALGRADGPLNLARVYLREGRIQEEAPAALQRARALGARPWSVLWFTGLVNKQNGRYEEAIQSFKEIVQGGFKEAAGRNFDFTRDYRLLNELGQTIYLRALQEPHDSAGREDYLKEAVQWFEKSLDQDPENLSAHWGLRQIYRVLGENEKARIHSEAHARYKPDDNARDYAVSVARRRDPAADHAAEDVVIYDLQRFDRLTFREKDGGQRPTVPTSETTETGARF